MCYQLVYLVFDYAEADALKDPGRVGRGLMALAEAGCRFEGDPGVDPAAGWTAAVRRSNRSAFIACVTPDGLPLTISLVMSQPRRLYLAVERTRMRGVGPADALAAAGTVLFEATGAEYGFGLVALDVEPLAPPADGDYGLAIVHDINLLGSRLTARYRDEQLGGLVVHRRQELAGGGILFSLTPDPLGEKAPYASVYQDAMRVLGAGRFQQGC